MTNTKWVLVTLFIFLVATNLLWLVQTKNIDETVKYHATHLCELERLSTLEELLPKGSSRAKVNKLCNQDAFGCLNEANTILITFDDLVSCPKSGRPYCGFRAKMNETNTLSNLTSGYPCH